MDLNILYLLILIILGAIAIFLHVKGFFIWLINLFRKLFTFLFHINDEQTQIPKKH